MKTAHANYGASFRYTQRPERRSVYVPKGVRNLSPGTTDNMEIVDAAAAAAADSAAYAVAAAAAAASAAAAAAA